MLLIAGMKLHHHQLTAAANHTRSNLLQAIVLPLYCCTRFLVTSVYTASQLQRV